MPRILIVDDLDGLDGLDDPSLDMAWYRLAKLDTLRVVATIETRSVGGFSPVSLLDEMRKARRATYLQPDDPMELFQVTGVRPPVRPGTPMSPGRGVLVVDRMPAMIQVQLS